MSLKIEVLAVQKAVNVANLHIERIATGFISSLGVGFVTALYEVIAEDENSFEFVALENDKVLDFMVFLANLKKR